MIAQALSRGITLRISIERDDRLTEASRATGMSKAAIVRLGIEHVLLVVETYPLVEAQALLFSGGPQPQAQEARE